MRFGCKYLPERMVAIGVDEKLWNINVQRPAKTVSNRANRNDELNQAHLHMRESPGEFVPRAAIGPQISHHCADAKCPPLIPTISDEGWSELRLSANSIFPERLEIVHPVLSKAGHRDQTKRDALRLSASNKTASERGSGTPACRGSADSVK